MAIQIQRRDGAYMYKISDDDETVILWRRNKHGAHWQFLAEFSTEDLARAALLTLEKPQEPPCHQ